MAQTGLVLEDLLQILTVAAFVAALVQRIHVPYTTTLVVSGVAVSFLPIVPDLGAYIVPGILVVGIVLLSRVLTVYSVYYMVSKTEEAFPLGWPTSWSGSDCAARFPSLSFSGFPGTFPFGPSFSSSPKSLSTSRSSFRR